MISLLVFVLVNLSFILIFNILNRALIILPACIINNVKASDDYFKDSPGLSGLVRFIM